MKGSEAIDNYGSSSPPVSQTGAPPPVNTGSNGTNGTHGHNHRYGSVTSERFKAVSDLLPPGLSEAGIPGAVVLVGHRGQVVFSGAFGTKTLAENDGEKALPMTLETVFDLGSLSATVATTILAMKLVEAGKIKVDDRVSRIIQGIGVGGKSQITIANLLSQTSGLPTTAGFYDELFKLHTGSRLGILASSGAKQYVYDAILKIPLRQEPGTRQSFSELNFILLGQICEILCGLTLDRAFSRMVAQALGLKNTSFIDLSLMKRRGYHPIVEFFAPSGECPRRNRILCGEVLDENAWAMGGVAGHSGVFSTVFDLHILITELLLAREGRSQFLKRETVNLFWEYSTGSNGRSWHLGWDSPSRENGLQECNFGPRTIGANGDNGCSIWIDPDRAISVIMLSNAAYSGNLSKRTSGLRSELHSAVLQAL